MSPPILKETPPVLRRAASFDRASPSGARTAPPGAGKFCKCAQLCATAEGGGCAETVREASAEAIDVYDTSNGGRGGGDVALEALDGPDGDVFAVDAETLAFRKPRTRMRSASTVVVGISNLHG